MKQYAVWVGDNAPGYTKSGKEYEVVGIIEDYDKKGAKAYQIINDSGNLDTGHASLFGPIRYSHPLIFKLRTWYVTKFPSSKAALTDKFIKARQRSAILEQEYRELKDSLSSTDTVSRRDYDVAMGLAADLKKALEEQTALREAALDTIGTLQCHLSIAEQTMSSLDRRLARLAKDNAKLKAGSKKRAA